MTLWFAPNWQRSISFHGRRQNCFLQLVHVGVSLLPLDPSLSDLGRSSRPHQISTQLTCDKLPIVESIALSSHFPTTKVQLCLLV